MPATPSTADISRRRPGALLAVATIAVLAALAVGGVAGAALWQTDTASEPAAASWLFSHTARNALLEETADGNHRLTLTGIDVNVIAFTDRPDRQAAMLTPTALAAEWDELFADSAPNAVLVGHLPTGEAHSLVFELFDPVVDGQRMTYTVDVLADEVSSTEPSRQFTAVSLFIDSAIEPDDDREPPDDDDAEDNVWRKWEALR